MRLMAWKRTRTTNVAPSAIPRSEPRFGVDAQFHGLRNSQVTEREKERERERDRERERERAGERVGDGEIVYAPTCKRAMEWGH